MANEGKRKVGRPSDYTIDIARTICAKLASGVPLVRMCKETDMPGVVTVYRWLSENEEFRNMYAKAREDQADTMADEMLEIADICRTGVKTTTKANGDVETVTGDMVDRARLMLDARKWIAAKLKPRKYGDLTRIEGHVTGEVTVIHKPADELKALIRGAK